MKPWVTYPCQRCGDTVESSSYRIPGTHCTGRMLMEQYVCAKCFDGFVQVMSLYWPKDQPISPEKCAKCSAQLIESDVHITHYSQSSGVWTLANVCIKCFGTYQDQCKNSWESPLK